MGRYLIRWKLLQRMKAEAEVEYRLLLSSCEGKAAPDPLMLEILSYKSDNPWFRSQEFRLLLIDYRLHQYPRIIREYKERKRIDAKHRRARRKRLKE